MGRTTELVVPILLQLLKDQKVYSISRTAPAIFRPNLIHFQLAVFNNELLAMEEIDTHILFGINDFKTYHTLRTKLSERQ